MEEKMPFEIHYIDVSKLDQLMSFQEDERLEECYKILDFIKFEENKGNIVEFIGINYNQFIENVNIMINAIHRTSSKIKQSKMGTEKETLKNEYNASQFNEHTYKLFCYIVDEYENENIVKYINIWYYLKRDIDKTKYKNILFNFTIDKYKVFIKGKYKIEIKKFKKAPYKYDEVELPILENITKTYYASLKQIENT